MTIEKRDGTVWADIYWDDLLPEVQAMLLELMGDNGNFDVYTFASINVSTVVD